MWPQCGAGPQESPLYRLYVVPMSQLLGERACDKNGTFGVTRGKLFAPARMTLGKVLGSLSHDRRFSAGQC